MFVTKSKYNLLKSEFNTTLAKLSKLKVEWNSLVDTVNKKGGISFLQKGEINTQPKLDKATIKNLIFLCHPDKHNGSKKAEEATILLLEMLQ